MSFAVLSELWKSGTIAVKAASRLAHRSATGPSLGPGMNLYDETTIVHGDGRVEFSRRGDLGEREDFPPGQWSSACDPAQVEKMFARLGVLGPESFPTRVADPGDTLQQLAAYVGGRVQAMTIGPIDYSQPAPGDVFMQELYPILNASDTGECHWAVGMSLAGLECVADGANGHIRFRNPGKRPIGLVFEGNPASPDFHFRFAEKREENPYPEWHHCDVRFAGPDMIQLLLLEPGSEITRTVFFPCTFPDSGQYIGKIAYRQTRYLDTLAGIPILTGAAHTEMARFAV